MTTPTLLLYITGYDISMDYRQGWIPPFLCATILLDLPRLLLDPIGRPVGLDILLIGWSYTDYFSALINSPVPPAR